MPRPAPVPRLDLLAAELAREALEADASVAVHQHDERLRVLVLHHERLDDVVLVHAELARRLGGAAVLDVVVHVLAEGHAMAAQDLRRRRLADVAAALAHRDPPAYCAGSRISQRILSIAASNSGASVVPQASRFSSSCASEVTPMIVLAVCHLV